MWCSRTSTATRCRQTSRAIAGQPTCGTALGIRCDITSRADCERVVAQTIEKFGALHVLVNNAAKGQVHLERSRNDQIAEVLGVRS